MSLIYRKIKIEKQIDELCKTRAIHFSHRDKEPLNTSMWRHHQGHITRNTHQIAELREEWRELNVKR